MLFSVWPAPKRPTDEVLDLARQADQLGYFGFWFADHYMPDSGNEAAETGPVHEVFSILPAVAAVTQSIRVGPLVSPTSVHHPAVLANRAVTLDHVSHGRMVLGLGAGWQQNEHDAYGIALEEPKVRVDRFEEAIQIVRSLLDEDRTTFHGTHYTVTDAPSDPSPVQATLPIVVDQHLIDSINRYGELGFDEVIIPDFTLGETAEERSDAYARFVAEIAPHCP